MSKYEYVQSQQLSEHSFATIIMAAIRKADDQNSQKLRDSFPAIWAELYARYNSPGGVLPDETNHDGVNARYSPE